jgi:hypothetical protein
LLKNIFVNKYFCYQIYQMAVKGRQAAATSASEVASPELENKVRG